MNDVFIVNIVWNKKVFGDVLIAYCSEYIKSFLLKYPMPQSV